MSGTFEYYEVSGRWRWRLRAANGGVVATGVGYPTRASVLDAISTIQRATAGATTREATVVDSLWG